jgi:hypothetical protein
VDIEVAARCYPVRPERQLTDVFVERIMRLVQGYMALSQIEPACETFCKSLQLWELKKNPNFRPEKFVRETICKMILASLGGHEEKQRRARQVYVIKDALGPLITDGYVGVCCKSLQKLCIKVKAETLLPQEGGKRDTTYDGRLHSDYPMYVDSPRVCQRIVEEDWDPPTNVIARWVEICMGEAWKPTNRLRAICLNPLHLANKESVLEDLQVYIDKIQANVDHLLEGADTWHLVEAVDMVVIPVKVAGTWALYLTQKSTRQ